MRLSEMNWMQVEAYLQNDDRCVVPLGSTEQHAQLSLPVDSILSERVAAAAAEPLGVPVFPVLAYGITPYFPPIPAPSPCGWRPTCVVRDILDGLANSGFRRILLCNGHGGNSPAAGLAVEWMADHPSCRVRFHNWWSAPRTLEKIQAIDPVASHACWMENFPWTRLPNLRGPEQAKPMTDLDRLGCLPPRCAARSTMATSAGCINAATTKCWRFGRWPSRRPAP